ncbi:MAG: CRISPR system precrRNA processing endoribonuclease RAMP protein Cas6 [Aeromicrobium sp.]|uniref:CRISPR system precrRNA processing endoribonuclease RAMP protein Cas6 n=1 Tax=Aeromicrobium sp. TaxID=1871063 RepID=UPI0039E42E8C
MELQYLHGAISNWFDANEVEHKAGSKPYSLTPLSQRGEEFGVEIATLTSEAALRLHTACVQGTVVRLGPQQGRVAAAPTLVDVVAWESLGARPQNMWSLDFLTPTVFRRGKRYSPLPTPQSITRSLSYQWNAWSGLESIRLDHAEVDQVWVSSFEGGSHPIRLRFKREVTRTYEGFVGRLTLRCDDDTVAAATARLLGVAPYAGVGSFTLRGLGVTRFADVQEHRHAVAR